MLLQLKKPLVFLDIEATGLSVTKDRIVEVSMIKLHPDGKEEKKNWRVNPGIPIPEKIVELIHISNEDVAGLPAFKAVGRDIYNFMSGCDLSGYNLHKLDLPMLMEELQRLDIEFDISKRKLVDVQNIFHKMEQRNLAAAYKFYCGKNLENSHSSEADTQATYEILLAQVQKYEALGTDVDKICSVVSDPSARNVDVVGRMVFDEKERETFNFGKYKGELVEDVLKKDPGFYGWMMNGDFPTFTKKKLTEIRLRMKKN
jgi:DNA polymerase-3 subunit epsilon